MSASPDIRDLRQPDVALDEERLAADAALDAYIEAAPRAKVSVAHFLKNAYLRLLATARAQELQWLGVLERRLGSVCEKRRKDVHGGVMRKALAAVHKLHEFLFRRYSRVAFRLYSRALVDARGLEIENVLPQCHDCIGLARVLAQIDQKFDALKDALERRCQFENCHAFDYNKNHTVRKAK